MGRLFVVHTKRASLKMPFFLQVLFQFLEIRKEVAYGVREAFAGREDLEYGAHGLAELRIVLHEREDSARVDCIGERRVLTALEPASHRAECMLQREAVVQAEPVVAADRPTAYRASLHQSQGASAGTLFAAA